MYTPFEEYGSCKHSPVFPVPPVHRLILARVPGRLAYRVVLWDRRKFLVASLLYSFERSSILLETHVCS